MPATPQLTGISANTFTPGVFLEINFAAGAASGSSARKSAILIGNRTTAGTATVSTVVYGPDTATPAVTEADIITLTGAGSEIHRMWRRFTKVNKSTRLYFICVAESGGTAASGTVTIATTAAAVAFNRFWCGDEYVDTNIAVGDTATVIAAAIVVSINSKTHWPITATSSVGAITPLAKIKGPRGNFIAIQSQIICPSNLVLTTTTATAQTRLTSGATADSSTTVLSTLAPMNFYYSVSAAEDATQVGALVTQVNTQALPANGRRERAFYGALDSTIANLVTIATGINAARSEMVYQPASDWTPAELAANNAAVYALNEAEKNPRPLHNFDGYGNDPTTQATWVVPAPRSGTIISATDTETSLHNGITPIGGYVNGTSYLVKRVTNRSLSGTTADYRIRDSHKVTICDNFGDDLIAKTALNYPGFDIADDPVGNTPGPVKCIWPDSYKKNCIFPLIQLYADNGQIDPSRVAAIQAATTVVRDPSARTRLAVRVPLEPIDIWDSTAIALDQL